MAEQNSRNRLNINLNNGEKNDENKDTVTELETPMIKPTKSKSNLKKVGAVASQKKFNLASQIASFLSKADEEVIIKEGSVQQKVWETEDINFLNFQRFMKPVLVIPAAARTENDIDLLEKCTSYLNFFEKINMDDMEKKHNAHRRACKVMEYVEFKKGQSVFRFNDEPKDFFIVLKGEVGVFIPRTYTDQKREAVFLDKLITTLGRREVFEEEIIMYVKTKSLEKKEKEFLAHVKYIQSGKVIFYPEYLSKKIGGLSKKELEDTSLFNDNGTMAFDFVSALKEGSMFGELALIYNQPRLATIISLTPSEMCTMDKQNFEKILGVLQHQENQKKIEFIQNEILKGTELASLAHVIGVNFVKRHVNRHKLLFQQGDVPEKVFLIYSGQVRLWKTVVVQEEEDGPGETTGAAKVGFGIGGLRAAERRGRIKEQQNLLLRVNRKPKTIKKEFSLVGPGQMIGEEGLYSGNLRTYNATVDAETVLYEIDNERFLVACQNNIVVRTVMERIIQRKIKHLEVLELLADKLRYRLQQRVPARPPPITVSQHFNNNINDAQTTPESSKLQLERAWPIPISSLDTSLGGAPVRIPEESLERNKISRVITEGSVSDSRADLCQSSVLDSSMKKDLISLIDRNCRADKAPSSQLIGDLKKSNKRPMSPLFEFKLKQKLSKETARMLYKPYANIDTKKIILECLRKPVDYYSITHKRAESSVKDSDRDPSPKSARHKYRIASDPHKLRIEAAPFMHRRMNSHQLNLDYSKSQHDAPCHSVLGMSFSKNQSQNSLGGALSVANSLEVSKREIPLTLKRSISIEDQMVDPPSKLFITQLYPTLPNISCQNIMHRRRGGHSELSKEASVAASPSQAKSINPPLNSSWHRPPSSTNRSYLPDQNTRLPGSPKNPDQPINRLSSEVHSTLQTHLKSLSNRKVNMLPQRISEFSVEQTRQNRNNYLSMLHVQGLHDVLKMLPLQTSKENISKTGDEKVNSSGTNPIGRLKPCFRLKADKSHENLLQ
jgi:CRP-like cAMP-binding protein